MLSPSRLKERLFYGWVVVAVFFVTGTIIWGIRFSFGVFFNSIESEFELSRAVTSTISSVQMGLSAVCVILVGWALDRYGPRIVLFLMGLASGLSLVLTSQTTSLWQLFITYSVLVSMGTSAIFVVVMSTVSRWFDKKRGLAMGIAASGSGLGTFTIAPFAAYLIAGFDWRTAYLVIGLIAWAVVLPLAGFLKRSPYEVGALPDGVKGPTKSGEGAGVRTAAAGLLLLQAVRTRSFWLFICVWFLFASNIMLVMTHLVPHATDIGFSTVQAATVLSLTGGANAVGRVIMGVVSDKAGRKLTAIICPALTAIALFWLLWARELWMLYLFGFLFGFNWGGAGSVMAALIGEVFGLGHIGAILGLLDVGFSFGAAFGPAFGGLIFDASQSYFLAFLAGACGMLLATLFMALIRRETNDNCGSG